MLPFQRAVVLSRCISMYFDIVQSSLKKPVKMKGTANTPGSFEKSHGGNTLKLMPKCCRILI